MNPIQLLSRIAVEESPAQDRANQADDLELGPYSMKRRNLSSRLNIGHLRSVLTCWNWKCALMSAMVRSLVYLAAMTRENRRGSVAIVLVEICYVTLTAGIYAGLQQRALGLRSRMAGNFAIVLAVPALAQGLDWLAHHIAGAPAPAKATFAVCVFTAISALFHLYVMRRGAFLTGPDGHSLGNDFRRMPALLAGLAGGFVVLLTMSARAIAEAESQLGL